MRSVGVIGAGFVGSALIEGFEPIAEIFEHDAFKDSYSLETVVKECDIIFLCLPTPMNEDGSCNTFILEEVVEKIDQLHPSGKTIVIKSTVTPGTTRWLATEYKNHAFVFNPEYLREKSFINDFLEQDRIVLGYTDRDKHGERYLELYKLYSDFTKTQQISAEIFETDSDSAEMGKYIINTFLASKVTYCNEIKEICDASNIDYNKAMKVALLDKRIGKSHFSVPGPDGKHGFGGSCFSKDINGLIAFAEELGLDPIFLQSVWTKNLLIREEYEWEKLPQVMGNYDDTED